MSLYTRLVSELLFPLHERLKRHDSVQRLRELEESQWWSRSRLMELQAERLREFLVRVGREVPFYRDLFRKIGFQPQDVLSVGDLRQLPLLTKATIRQHAEEMKAEGAGPLKRFNTGGSSGEPLIFFMGGDRVSHDIAAKWRATRWWGVDIGDPEIVVWGSPIELGAQDRVRWVRDAVLRSHLLPAFAMSERKLDDFVEVIRRRRPRMLFGYPSALALIARHAERRGVMLNEIGIRVAFVTSERLYDEQRERIGRVFGCPVANGYGGRDAGFLAHECPNGGLHLSVEDIVVEILDSRGDPVSCGEPGEIVVTHLATREFPFLRYRTGDIGVQDDRACECGRGLPLLKEVQGRSTDFVIASDGTVMHGLALIYVLRELSGIEQFKIIQESRALTRVLLVSRGHVNHEIQRRIKAGLRARLGDDVRIEVEQVDAIAPEKSGKFRYVVSHEAMGSEPA